MKVLIIGANGSLAKWVINEFLQTTDVNLKLFLRKSKRLERLKSDRVELFEGDATDKNTLKEAMKDVDIVYANLAGDLVKMAKMLVEAMNESGLKRVIWVSSYGIYGETAMGSLKNILVPYRDSVLLIEASDLDYTIIRPQWFSSADEVDYEITKKGEPFKNPDAYISRKSIAHFVVRLAKEPNFGIKESFGINKPAR
ncbi:NAD-dependent dehydratase [Campylobacter fetus]|nr:NAD(P)H-binding protein [Campylobacter fetus subsp. venerealis]RUT49516.1 NAD-dependent dehydratase [Campylobacter fetus]RUT49776.1 NAD-dependent dehydratase [Campylobacter fetus]